MILLDLQPVMIANLMVGTSNGSDASDLSEGLLRHMVLSTIKSIRQKFTKEYGEMVICCDGRNVWRRDYFPYYKAVRKKARDESALDWGMIFATLEKIRVEIQTYMPYTTIFNDRAEADDVIGAIVHYERNRPVDIFNRPKPILIVSGDHDFVQLHGEGVHQWDHIRKRWITGVPGTHLRSKIICGDVGDGVPNYLSDDDTLVVKEKRQKPITQVNEAKWLVDAGNTFLDTPEKKKNWERNEILVDLKQVPDDIVADIVDKYSRPTTNTRASVQAYFVEAGLRNLMQDIQEFVS